MNAAGKKAVSEAFAEILGRQRPSLSWSARPIERAKVELSTGAGKVTGTLAPPEDDRPLIDRNVGSTGAPDKHRVDALA